MTTPESPEALAGLLFALEARHGDTWPTQIGYGDLINQDGPEAAALIRRLAGEVERARHSANEWADMATSGIQWLRNVRDGMSSVEAALENMDECLAHCQEVAALTTPPTDGDAA